ncbi:hypothetical protein Rs2_25483 [Raphanus sativus]|nr:hypothetical protein Rs2_25483 [Raphanus sativus]
MRRKEMIQALIHLCNLKVVASDPATTSFLEISIAVVSLQAVRSFSSSSSSQLVVAVSVALFADFLGLGDTFRSIICAVSMNEDVQIALSEATSSLLMLCECGSPEDG